MARRRRRRNKNPETQTPPKRTLHSETKFSILAIALLGLAVLFALAGFKQAGPAGDFLFGLFEALLGWGYFLVPLVLILIGLNILTRAKRMVMGWALLASLFFVLAGLGLIDIVFAEKGGIIGRLLGSLADLFGTAAAIIINLTILIISTLVVLNAPLHLKLFRKEEERSPVGGEPKIIMPAAPEGGAASSEEASLAPSEREPREPESPPTAPAIPPSPLPLSLEREMIHKSRTYVPPPLNLLKSSTEKPTVGDLRANANIIKRSLESFGIPVEMGEITIGPKVTRYTLKPAEGIKLSRITALKSDLSLALAAHPIRIEAPIPGRSLVGIEIPNKVGSIVRLGAILAYPDFKKSANLAFPLGRDVAGEPIFVNLSRMPHLLIAGSTGSGKSIAIHSLILSMLYKNSPEILRFILIDPKRVELSVYENIPHLLTPVITEGKKAIAALRFAIHEMERRYEVLLKAGKRDIAGYNAERNPPSGGEPMPYLVIIIDELADLMSAYGREIEGSIVRLAQMARATGIHLVVSTQRPSVEIITGLIKANISSRIALQVASQVDSRTILDMAGAESLLGGGDMLFLSAELSKPRRIQGTYVGEEEVTAVVEFIRKENPAYESNHLGEEAARSLNRPRVDDFGEEEGVDDELYEEAVRVVKEAKKASASLLQRRLRIGYARAARLIDIMEERGIVGYAEGAKPRPVFISEEEHGTS